MSLIVLKDKVDEESVLPLALTFKDEDGAVMTPTSVKWSLSEADGTIVNGRTDVTLSGPPYNLVLSGDDTALQEADDNLERRLTVRAVYTSDYGSGLKLNREIQFYIQPLVNVPTPTAPP